MNETIHVHVVYLPTVVNCDDIYGAWITGMYLSLHCL